MWYPRKWEKNKEKGNDEDLCELCAKPGGSS